MILYASLHQIGAALVYLFVSIVLQTILIFWAVDFFLFAHCMEISHSHRNVCVCIYSFNLTLEIQRKKIVKKRVYGKALKQSKDAGKQ